MAIARRHLVDESRSGCYHLISRCVRRAFLCGDGCEHRRAWIERAIRISSQAFAVDVLAFSVMHNHLHLVLRSDPERAQSWTAMQVAERWSLLFPQRDQDGGEQPWSLPELERLAGNTTRIAELRQRLASLSWLMRLLKQRIARRANKEDGCRGHFWEGRFTSVPLLDQAAVVSCMAYCDLNPVRAEMAKTPEGSDYTSAQLRIRQRQRWRKARRYLQELEQRSRSRQVISATLRREAEQVAAAGPEDGLWIAPLQRCRFSEHSPTLSVDDYLELLDATGRVLRSGKRGAIPAQLAPILQRLDIEVESWLRVMLSHGSFLGTAVGSAIAIGTEAIRRGLRWVVDRTKIHASHRRPAPSG